MDFVYVHILMYTWHTPGYNSRLSFSETTAVVDTVWLHFVLVSYAAASKRFEEQSLDYTRVE